MRLTVVVPAYNEAATLEETVTRLNRYLGGAFPGSRIAIVEDGSTDGTDKIAARLAASGRVDHYHFPQKLGKGGGLTAALRGGLLGQAPGPLILMDADLPVPVEGIGRMARLLGRYDLVLASRLHPQSRVRRPLVRRVFSRGYNTLARALFGTGIRDHQCGCKAFRREALERIVPRLRVRDFFWDTEVVVAALDAGLRIAQLPVAWKEREKGRSKVSVGKETMRFSRNLFAFWLRRW